MIIAISNKTEFRLNNAHSKFNYLFEWLPGKWMATKWFTTFRSNWYKVTVKFFFIFLPLSTNKFRLTNSLFKTLTINHWIIANEKKFSRISVVRVRTLFAIGPEIPSWAWLPAIECGKFWTNCMETIVVFSTITQIVWILCFLSSSLFLSLFLVLEFIWVPNSAKLSSVLNESIIESIVVVGWRAYFKMSQTMFLHWKLAVKKWCAIHETTIIRFYFQRLAFLSGIRHDIYTILISINNLLGSILFDGIIRDKCATHL